MNNSRSPLYNGNKVIKEEESGGGALRANDFRERSSITHTATAAAVATEVDEMGKKVGAPPHRLASPERIQSPDINESAEAFIKKFRQQLVIQRLESIENYEKMLARGT